uniref:DM2 domain-containing protein n=1 Tax=Aegilops tauschii subsp. strangulata TaxID=200361 RepID=A0A453LW72_AEGTS
VGTVHPRVISLPEQQLGDGKKKAGGFTKLCSISPALQEFVGASECARTEVVKKLWAYIRENNLQDPSNRRKILCDENLKKIFNVNSIDMFQMNKALTKHIWPLDSDGLSLYPLSLSLSLSLAYTRACASRGYEA